MNAANKDVVQRYVGAFNRSDWEGPARAVRARRADLRRPRLGEIDEVMPVWRDLVHSLKINLTVEDICAEGGTVAIRYTERGTFVAPYRGKPPTEKSYELVAMEWFKLEGGKVTRRWGAGDAESQSRQLGMS